MYSLSKFFAFSYKIVCSSSPCVENAGVISLSLSHRFRLSIRLFLKSLNNESAASTNASFTISPSWKDFLCLTMQWLTRKDARLGSSCPNSHQNNNYPLHRTDLPEVVELSPNIPETVFKETSLLKMKTPKTSVCSVNSQHRTHCG